MKLKALEELEKAMQVKVALEIVEADVKRRKEKFEKAEALKALEIAEANAKSRQEAKKKADALKA